MCIRDRYWFVWPIILDCLLVAIGYFTVSKDLYQCPSCKKVFKITALQDFFALHGITKGSNGQVYEWKLLKWPGCNKREKCYRRVGIKEWNLTPRRVTWMFLGSFPLVYDFADSVGVFRRKDKHSANLGNNLNGAGKRSRIRHWTVKTNSDTYP